MATPTNLSSRINHNLHLLSTELADLPEIAAEWSASSDGNRASYAIEWWDLMVRFRELYEARQSNQMTAAQAEKYREIARRLQEQLPVIRRLGLAEPPVPLHEAA